MTYRVATTYLSQLQDCLLLTCHFRRLGVHLLLEPLQQLLGVQLVLLLSPCLLF